MVRPEAEPQFAGSIPRGDGEIHVLKLGIIFWKRFGSSVDHHTFTPHPAL